MSKDDGGPAFPRTTYHNGNNGMSLRDWFAGMALSGWYTNAGGLPPETALERYAHHFYSIADAMLAERNKRDE